jgi:hypothetical protein
MLIDLLVKYVVFCKSIIYWLVVQNSHCLYTIDFSEFSQVSFVYIVNKHVDKHLGWLVVVV